MWLATATLNSVQKIFAALFALFAFWVTFTAAQTPPYSGSIFIENDIITAKDPTSFETLTFERVTSGFQYDHRPNEKVPSEFFRFKARFRDRQSVVVDINTEFFDKTIATGVAHKYATVLGQLPRILRRGVRQIVVHETGEGWSASPKGLIVIQHGTFRKSQRTGTLEERMFHESVHTSIDRKIERLAAWRNAQRDDGSFLTDYAALSPKAEDVAESFLAHFALTTRPNRLSSWAKRRIKAAIPHRLAVLAKMYPASKLGI